MSQLVFFPAHREGGFVVTFVDGGQLLVSSYDDHGSVFLAELQDGSRICLLLERTLLIGRILAVADTWESCKIGR